MARDEVIGTTVSGRPIEAIVFSPPRYAKPRPPAIVFGAIHGDEPASRLQAERLIEELLDRPPGRETWIIPVVNVDGLLGGSKNNARDVDLNRNFAATNWVATYQGGYFPGATPESEPETQALASLIDRSGAERLIALHATFRVMNWDGRGQALAEEMARLAGYPAAGDIGYPTPGSFGSKYGLDRGLEVVTVEVPYLEVDERAWTDTRTALRWALDLPS
ncbi:MAG: succinylglutamate desuccinylase/aspartoacylase family protein [Myxococcales bacterium]|mgnify:CR=1 FL=1|nr:succinylglutamate desuccinylase/aspartoacylase family protein [Myxococcales bacterium]MBK7194680.1 succinylglutamate desuccinylase/aspartoacylase family protein [Myxococcales bacterium]MBP6845396.1 succinylglutamate desuccinylase/aspartoacylase family protein [Kofleriaceae bacterium]